MGRLLSLLATLGLVLATGCSWPWSRQPSEVERLEALSGGRFQELDLQGLEADLARPRGGLKLSISTNRTEYYVGEPIIVELRLENVGSPEPGKPPRDIPVYFEPVAHFRGGRQAEWLVNFFIRSESDGRAVYRSPRVTVPDQQRASYYHYVVLPPHSYVGRRFVFWPRRAPGLMRPGRYSLRAIYSVSDDFAYVIVNKDLTAEQVEILGERLAYVRVWTGRLYSNKVEFRIKRKRRWLFF